MRKRTKKWTKRPLAVSAVAWAVVVLFLIRLYQFIKPLASQGLFTDGITEPLFVGAKPTALGSALLFSGGYLALSLAGLVVLAGFLRMRRWSWVVLMAWTGISLAIVLINYFYGEPNFAVMAADTVIVFALNQSDVLRLYGIRMDQA